MESDSNINFRQFLTNHSHALEHAAGQVIAPFVGEIVGKFVAFFNRVGSAQKAENIQWLTSALVAMVMIEVRYRMFNGLEEAIGKVKSSIVSVVVPTTVTTGVSYMAHSAAGTDAEVSAAVVGVLSIIGYSSLQCFQLLSRGTEEIE